MVFVPSARSPGAEECSFGKQSIGTNNCSGGFTVDRTSNSITSHKLSLQKFYDEDHSVGGMEVGYGDSRPRKIRRRDHCDSSSDDEISSVIESDDEQRTSTNSAATTPEARETPSAKKDGLSLLLEALLQSSGSQDNTTCFESDEFDCDDKRKRSERSASPSLSDSERWSMMFEALEEYGRINGHCNAPNSYECVVRSGMGVKLGTWLSTQRQLKRKGNLRPERDLKLQQLVDEGLLQWSMPSIASPDDEKWSVMYGALLRYGQKYNHCNVPYSHDCTLEDGTTVKLGAWLRKQREQKKKGSLRSDRDARLLALVDANMLRMPSSHATDDDQWSTMMEALEAYGSKHGHGNVPQSLEYRCEDGTIIRLGAWLRKQRELKKKNSLRPDRLSMLRGLVEENLLLWDAPCHCPSDDEKWDIMLEALVRYSQEKGHCNLSSCHEYAIYDGTTVKLGAWLSQQRHHKKKGKLRPDREAKLQVLVEQGKLQWGMRYDNTAPAVPSTSAIATSPQSELSMLGCESISPV